jgi:NAD(P)-dependent dehydrogenase (short-subunit alcohol dehydrogenase family)
MAKGHKDKVAVITGAANGIGQAFAKRLAEDGVHVAIVDVVDGKATVKMVEAAGRQALAVNCDVSSEGSVTAMATEVQGKFSRVDIVVNCAGIFPQKNFPEMTFADWRKVLVEVPEDLVGAVSFLTSDDAAFMTGQTLNVDGGRVRS